VNVLSGFRVIDMTHAIAGPTCTQWLRFLGAEVIKVETPGEGESFRSYHVKPGEDEVSLPFATINSGKKSMTLDLKTPAGREVMSRLVRRADVFVQNYRPGAAERLGVGWQELSELNERLVYCTISGFGSSSPLSGRVAYDHIVQAMSGIMYINGESSDKPMKVGPPIADQFSGFSACTGVLGALLQRERTGKGDRVEISMLDCMMSLLGLYVTPYLTKGRAPERLGNAGYRAVPTSTMFVTNDGMIAVSANHDEQFRDLCSILGLDLHTDERFATHAARVRNAEFLDPLLNDAFARRSASELETELTARKISAARVRSLPEILSEQYEQRDGSAIKHVDASPAIADIPIVGLPFQYDGAGDSEVLRLSSLGEDTDAVLRDLGYEAEAINALRRDGVV
jgi:CoA:oxalate CoA-transferase